jgi:hypothetical protein
VGHDRLEGRLAGVAILIGLLIFIIGYRLPDQIPPPPSSRAPAPVDGRQRAAR